MNDYTARSASRGARFLEPAPWRQSNEFSEKIRSGAFGSPRVREWRDQMTRIKEDLTDLLASRSVIERLREVIAANEQLQGMELLS